MKIVRKLSKKKTLNGCLGNTPVEVYDKVYHDVIIRTSMSYFPNQETLLAHLENDVDQAALSSRINFFNSNTFTKYTTNLYFQGDTPYLNFVFKRFLPELVNMALFIPQFTTTSRSLRYAICTNIGDTYTQADSIKVFEIYKKEGAALGNVTNNNYISNWVASPGLKQLTRTNIGCFAANIEAYTLSIDLYMNSIANILGEKEQILKNGLCMSFISYSTDSDNNSSSFSDAIRSNILQVTYKN